MERQSHKVAGAPLDWRALSNQLSLAADAVSVPACLTANRVTFPRRRVWLREARGGPARSRTGRRLWRRDCASRSGIRIFRREHLSQREREFLDLARIQPNRASERGTMQLSQSPRMHTPGASFLEAIRIPAGFRRRRRSYLRDAPGEWRIHPDREREWQATPCLPLRRESERTGRRGRGRACIPTTAGQRPINTSRSEMSLVASEMNSSGHSFSLAVRLTGKSFRLRCASSRISSDRFWLK